MRTFHKNIKNQASASVVSSAGRVVTSRRVRFHSL